MVDDIDIYRSAQVLVKRYGEDAPIQASSRADEFRDKGNVAGGAVWLRIMKAAEELLRIGRCEGEGVH